MIQIVFTCHRKGRTAEREKEEIVCGSTHDNHSSIFTLFLFSCLNLVFVCVCVGGDCMCMYIHENVFGACEGGTSVCLCLWRPEVDVRFLA